MKTTSGTTGETANQADGNSSFPLDAAHASVSEALILVCEKCGKKMMAAGDTVNPALELQQQLKADIKEQFGKGIVRAVSASCLDVCPQNQIAIAVARPAPKGLEFFKFSRAETEAVRQKILSWFR